MDGLSSDMQKKQRGRLAGLLARGKAADEAGREVSRRPNSQARRIFARELSIESNRTFRRRCAEPFD